MVALTWWGIVVVAVLAFMGLWLLLIRRRVAADRADVARRLSGMAEISHGGRWSRGRFEPVNGRVDESGGA